MLASKSRTGRLAPTPEPDNPRAATILTAPSPATRRTSKATVETERRIRAQDVSRSAHGRVLRFRVSLSAEGLFSILPMRARGSGWGRGGRHETGIPRDRFGHARQTIDGRLDPVFRPGTD